TSDQTLSRKAREAWLAMQLEQRATKQEILTYYINKVYMSNGNYGMKTAAQSYYGKELKDLSLPQLALLAGMPQAPNQYDPYSNPEAALERRNLVLGEMKEMNYITAEQ
ncbi:transglycosylase domain-containing protein, partial [Streptococcus danieliae]|nr:transglycosylase domain-containing protein [Streptococcus danieliae]